MSVTTVSHALNGKGRLNAETRKRVREVADRLGYRPNPAARSLVSGRTGLIAAMPSLPPELDIEFTEFGFFSELITAATGVAVGRDKRSWSSPAGRRLVRLGSRAARRRDRDRAGGRRAGAPGPATPRHPVRHDLDRPRRRGATMRSCARTTASGVERVLDHLVDAGADAVAMLAPPPLQRVHPRQRRNVPSMVHLASGRPPLLDVVAEEDLIADPEAPTSPALGSAARPTARPPTRCSCRSSSPASVLELLKDARDRDARRAATRDDARYRRGRDDRRRRSRRSSGTTRSSAVARHRCCWT